MLSPLTSHRAFTAAVVMPFAVAGLTGCGADDEKASARASATSPSVPSTPPAESTSPSPSTTPAGTPSRADACLLTPAGIGKALKGTWRVVSRTRANCTYASTRGEVFGLQDVQEPDAQVGLGYARHNCARPLKVAGTTAFACDQDEAVFGSFIAEGRLWLTYVPAPPKRDHTAEVDATLTILELADPT